MINDKFVQVHGPFKKNEELVNIIKTNYPDFQYIKKIGIQTSAGNICRLNGQNFEIGKTGILEFSEVHITSIYFRQDEPSSTLVDCILG